MHQAIDELGREYRVILRIGLQLLGTRREFLSHLPSHLTKTQHKIISDAATDMAPQSPAPTAAFL
jgi:hypothetical protein